MAGRPTTPLTEPDLWASHPALWNEFFMVKQRKLTRDQLNSVQTQPRVRQGKHSCPKPRIGIGTRHPRTVAAMPCTTTTPCRPSGSTPTYAARKQCPEKKTVSSLLVNDDCPYPTSNMGIEHSEEIRSLLRADPEVGKPATKVFIQPLETSLERLSPASRSQLPDSEFQPIDCPLGQMHLHLAIRFSFKTKPQKVPLFWTGHSTLVFVDQKTQMAF